MLLASNWSLDGSATISTTSGSHEHGVA